jgi:hypothetical protein
MQKRLSQITSYLIATSFLMTGCGFILPKPTPTPTMIPPTATSTVIPPTETPTIIPTPKPSPTPQPSPTPSCSRDSVLANLKKNVPYAVFDINYNSILDTSILGVWFVDPNVNPKTLKMDPMDSAYLAFSHTVSLSQEINYKDRCIEELFDSINLVVVDSGYNGWISVSVEPSKLPRIQNPNEAHLDGIMDDFQIFYVREKAPPKSRTAPAKSCSWLEASRNIQSHFDSARENVSFQYIIDQTSAHVDAQWDSDLGNLEPKMWGAVQVASMLNIAMELNCLYPVPTVLNITVVDSSGKVLLVGSLPKPNRPINQIDFNDFKITYANLK